MLNAFVLSLAVVLTVVAQLFIKRGVAGLSQTELSFAGLSLLVLEIFRNLYLFFGLFLLGITFILWIWLVSKMQLGVLYPLTVSGQIALLALGTWFFFGETLTLQQFIGLLVIVAGIFLISYTA